MRSFGNRPGLTVLRASVESTARRRMVSRGGALLHDAAMDDLYTPWSRPFFDRLRTVVEQRFADVLALPQGGLRYFGTQGLQLWGLVSESALVLALDHEDAPDQIVERAKRWESCLNTRTTPGLASPHWGHPVYGARLDPRSGMLDVVWAFAGEWCGLAEPDAPLERVHDRPGHWSSLTLSPR